MAWTGFSHRVAAALLFPALAAAACGARSALEVEGAGGSTSTVTTASSSTSSTTTSSSSTSSSSGCVEGATQVCGSDVGACKTGLETCQGGAFGPCEGSVGPVPEACNGIDENCNGTVDDCDPGSGACTPTLTVTSSTPSSPNCIDFPVMTGSPGTITYTCPGTGGAVTAVLGSITFTGTVTNNVVTLDSLVTINPPETPDGCVWQDHHHIEGDIHSLMLTYSYSEMVVSKPPGVGGCWSPCTEAGTVAVTFP
jgi:hypothetical protein